jgi:pyruvate/2-oxoglutarate/acetoin dehydrogenase E1 component
VRRVGRHVTVVAIGGMVPKALDAAEELVARDIDVEVIDPRTLVPLDKDTILASVRKTGRVIIAQEAHKRLGPASEIAAVIAEEGIGWVDAPIVRVAARNTPLPYSPDLERYVLPSTKDIAEAVEKLVKYAL